MSLVSDREDLIQQVCEILVSHQVPEGGVRCRCSAPLYLGKEGFTTLTRHRAERIVDDIIMAGVR